MVLKKLVLVCMLLLTVIASNALTILNGIADSCMMFKENGCTFIVKSVFQTKTLPFHEVIFKVMKTVGVTIGNESKIVFTDHPMNAVWIVLDDAQVYAFTADELEISGIATMPIIEVVVMRARELLSRPGQRESRLVNKQKILAQ